MLQQPIPPIVARSLIAAIATAPGRGGIGVVRISGKGAATLAQRIVGKSLKPRVATFAVFRDAVGNVIDQGIALYFHGPHSYTGEDVVELQGHGGPAVMQILLRRCLDLGCRIAKPGEFTERAFLNGKIDLAQAEGVADLIDSNSEAAARSAARTLTGEFSACVLSITEQLTALRAHVEACIDFPEEEIDPKDRTAQQNTLEDVRGQLASLTQNARQGAILRDGLTVVLIGRPNVGKSSLLNRLAGDDVAIVTAVAGTTRDHIKASISLDGVPIHLIDTAGLRQTEDEVEKIGISRTWVAIEKADAALLIMESGRPITSEDIEILARLHEELPLAYVCNKIDLPGAALVSRETIVAETGGSRDRLYVSALSGEGIEGLRHWLLKTAGWLSGNEGTFLARERHLRALAEATSHLEVASNLGGQLELFAEELRLAQRALSTIVGEFSADDLLGEIFGRFCIGK